MPAPQARLAEEDEMNHATPCEACHRRPALRKYCSPCSPKASAIYKRQLRREARAAGHRYWRDWWEKAYGSEAESRRRDFHRTYMRLYRKRVRRLKRARAVHP